MPPTQPSQLLPARLLDSVPQRFEEEMEILKERYDGVDQAALISRLLRQEIKFCVVEKDDLPALAERPRDHARVYVLGHSHFFQSLPSEAVVVNTLTPKALGLAGDEHLSTAAREALPANARVNKKAVELMGSTKVVTEKKALKRLGSEMSEDMRRLQVKTERRELREEEMRRERATASPAAGGARPDSPTSAIQQTMLAIRLRSP